MWVCVFTYSNRNIFSICWIQQKLHQQEIPSEKIEGKGNREEQALFLEKIMETSGKGQRT